MRKLYARRQVVDPSNRRLRVRVEERYDEHLVAA